MQYKEAVDKVLYLGTSNPNKIREMTALLQSMGIKAKTLDGIPEVDETARSYRGNALLKARTLARLYHVPVLSEDSGLGVRALGGAPGLHTGRFSGAADHNSKDNVAKLLNVMKGIRDRRAGFVTAAAISDGVNDQTVTRRTPGTITEAPRGVKGFAYDTVFVPKGSTQTYAESGDKAGSSRDKAVKALLERYYGLPKQASVQDSSKLLALGLWGMGKYRYNKANELGALPENRVKTAKALATLRKMKLIPKNTYIATNPKQFEYYAQHLGYDKKDNQNEYWMYPLYRTGKDGKDHVSGAFINAPENEHGMVNFPALRHELGHALDYLNGDAEAADHQGALARFGDVFKGVFNPLGTAKGGKERRAWDLAGIPEGDKMREAALDTYRLALRTELAKYVIPVLGVAGGAIPAGLLAKPDIGAQLDNIEKINMEGIGGKARPMKQLGKTRQAVVLQGMPAKLRNQVASVDNEMDGDYLVTLNDGSQAVYTPGEKEFY